MAMAKPTIATMTIRKMIRAITGSRIEFCRVPYRARYHRRESGSQYGVVRSRRLLRGFKLDLYGFRGRLGGRFKLPLANYGHGRCHKGWIAAHGLRRLYVARGFDSDQQLDRASDT